MEHRNPKKTHAMLRFDLMIAGALALAVGLFALLYSGGGVAILTAAATEDNGEEQDPSFAHATKPNPVTGARFYGGPSDSLYGKRPLGI